jgi:hypothetical protein
LPTATIRRLYGCPSESRTTVYIYYGPFQGPSFELDTEPQDLTIAPHTRIPQLTETGYSTNTYDPRLVRVCFGGPYPEPVFYHGHDGAIRPPEPTDAPDRTYMAYGSSITHGTGLSGRGDFLPGPGCLATGLSTEELWRQRLLPLRERLG